MDTIVPNGWCPACRRTVRAWGPGPGGRPDAACPHCHSLERHRLVALVLDALAPLLDDGRLIVEAAPTPTLRRMLIERVGRERYVGFDLGLDARDIDLYADLTRLPFADGSIQVLVCFHVLEHVPDDRAAMREIARVLSDDGVALVMNPWARAGRTEEDPDAPEEERIRRFGQRDHVRLYGSDFEDRLREEGLHVQRFEPVLRLPLDLLVRANLGEDPLWLLTAAGDRADDARRRLAALVPAHGGTLTSVRAASIAPVVVVSIDGDETAAELLAGVTGLRLTPGTGVLDRIGQLLTVLREGAWDRGRFAEHELGVIEEMVRSYLGDVGDARWGEVLPGATSEAALDRLELLLDRLPSAQVVHVVDGGGLPSSAQIALRTTCRAAGVRRYLEVDRREPEEARRRVAAFVRVPDPVSAP